MRHAQEEVLHGNNFTALRWLAAGMVLYGHSFVFLGLPEPTFMGWVPMGQLGVMIFFAISGYLVSESWERDPDMLRFLQRRALRIFPGLAVCIVLSVLVLGPLLTTWKLSDYILNEHTRSYFTNIWLYITYYLPGVFEHNRVPNTVNGSLWSLPAEFLMYLALALVGFVRMPRIGLVVIAVALMVLKPWALQTPDAVGVYGSDVRQAVLCGAYFWVGAAFYRYRIHRFISTTTVLGAVMVWASLTRWPVIFVTAAWVMLPFLALAFGLAYNSWLCRFDRHDYSYGIYIYAFPVQQTVACYWPQMPIGTFLAIAGSATIALAALSRHLVESPALNLRPSRPKPESDRTLSPEAQAHRPRLAQYMTYRRRNMRATNDSSSSIAPGQASSGGRAP